MHPRLQKFLNWAGRKMVSSATTIEDKQYLEYLINRWKASPVRIDQITGDRYYRGDHDILMRKRLASDGHGGQIEVKDLPNYRTVDNQFAKMVDQKSNFLFGQDVTVSCQDENYLELLETIVNKEFDKVLSELATASIIGGIAWLYVYYDENGRISFRVIPSWQIMPIWKDSKHTELTAAVRVYEEVYFNGVREEIIDRVEVYKTDGIEKYVLVGGSLMPDDVYPKRAYLSVEIDGNETPLNWGKIPLIPFKANHTEIPLIKRCKSLQDGINSILSTFQNNMEEDYRNTLLIVKNYDGQDLGELRRNIATYGIIKVRSIDGIDGGVDSLQVEVNAENYKSLLERLKRSLISNCRGYDAAELRDGNGSTANEMNIKSVYSDITIDSYEMESEYQFSLNELLWFINKYLGASTVEPVEWIFNRDTVVSESAVINDIKNSVGILSDETLIEQHPYVDDIKKELDRIAKQKSQDDIYSRVFNDEQIDEEVPEEQKQEQ